REHESLLVEWAHAGMRLLRWAVVAEGVQAAAGFGLAGGLILLDAGRLADAAGVLLLAYWALSLPLLGEELALLARQYPEQRSTTLRVLEPLGAPEADDADSGPASGSEEANPDPDNDTDTDSESAAGGVAIALESVGVRAAGHTILRDVTLAIAAG